MLDSSYMCQVVNLTLPIALHVTLSVIVFIAYHLLSTHCKINGVRVRVYHNIIKSCLIT